MSTDRTRPVQRGLLVHDPRVTLDPTHADHTWLDVGPRPGVPEDQGSPRSMLVLRSGGSMERDARLQLRATRAGYAGDRRRAGGYVYRDGEQDWRGWDVPTVVTSWEWIQRSQSPITTSITQVHMLRLQDGRVLLVGRYLVLAGQAAQIIIRRYDPATGAWTTMPTVGLGSVLAGEVLRDAVWPCLVQLPGGRVLMFAWVSDGSTYSQVATWRSDDAGETWTLASRWALTVEVDRSLYTPGKLRAALAGGQLALAAAVTHIADSESYIWQWASDDMGSRFLRVTETPPPGSSPEWLVRNDGALRCFFVGPDPAYALVRADLASPWTPIDDTNTGSSVFAAGPHQDVVVWPDEDGGWLGAVSRRLDSTEAARIGVARSRDEGLHWDILGDAWPIGGASGHLAYELAAAETCGRSMMACRFVDEVSNLDVSSSLILYLGGHTTVTMPARLRSRREQDQAAWKAFWVPIDPPEAWTGWSVAGSGVHSATLTTGGIEVTTAAAGVRQYVYGGLDTGSQHESVVEMEVEPLAMTGAGAYVSLAAWVGTSSGGSGAEVRLSDGALQLVDALTAGTLGSIVSLDGLAGTYQVRLAVAVGRARVWYRLMSAPGEAERPWQTGPVGNPTTGTMLPDLGRMRVRVAGGASGATVTVRRMVGVGLIAAMGLASGPSYPAELFPRSFSAYPTRLPGGVTVEATAGPAHDGEAWHVSPRFEFSAELVDPVRYPSPRRVARSGTTGSPAMVYDLSSLQGVATRLDTSSWGVGIYGASTCDVQLHGWSGSDWMPLTSGSSWVEDLAFERLGEAVHPDPTELDPAVEPLYIERDMLAGGVIDLGDGVMRRIARNTEGWWGPGPSRPPVLYLDADHLGGAPPTSGTCRIGPGERGQVIIVHGLDRYSRLRVTYGAGWGSTVQVGTVVVGPVLLWGQEYAWGRTLTTSPQTTLATMRDGTRHSRVEGPPRRAVEFGWSEGVYDRPLWSGYAPDYIRGGPGGEPVAVAADVGSMLEGLMRQLQGPHRPVVYLPAVSSDVAEVRLLWPSQHMLGRIVGDLRREPYLGFEREGELERVASIRIEEEV